MSRDEYDALQIERPELKLPDWNELHPLKVDEISSPGFDAAAERAAYILAGGGTRWPHDTWEYDVPF
jgi:hypothetical protein